MRFAAVLGVIVGCAASGTAIGALIPHLLLPESQSIAYRDRATATVALVGQTAQAPSGSAGSATERRPLPNFLVFAGGGAPAYNEIALEKNVLYFQRTLQAFGLDPVEASIFFANGNDGQTTVRYLDESRQEQFKAPDIPYLDGAATIANVGQWMEGTVRSRDLRPVFFYFTGHGAHNEQNEDNNALILWEEYFLSVRELAGMLDELPEEVPVAMMMAQCYSGSFANLIYEAGDPRQPVDSQTRCGFFATVKSRPSVGCTPEVDEADYRDYSSSFFAGLSGMDRIGNRVESADYDQNGTIAYAEAHAFAKVDAATPDWPISTAEAWLQTQVSDADVHRILRQPIAQILQTARPEQQHVVQSLAEKLGANLQRSYTQNELKFSFLRHFRRDSEVNDAYAVRLRMELINIAAERQVRESGDGGAIAILERLLKCEFSSWTHPAA